MRHDTLVVPDVSLSDAARICAVSGKTIRRWVRSGLLTAVKVGGRYRTTNEWIRSLSVEVQPVKHEVKRNACRKEKKARERIEAKWGFKKKVPGS